MPAASSATCTFRTVTAALVIGWAPRASVFRIVFTLIPAGRAVAEDVIVIMSSALATCRHRSDATGCYALARMCGLSDQVICGRANREQENEQLGKSRRGLRK